MPPSGFVAVTLSLINFSYDSEGGFPSYKPALQWHQEPLEYGGGPPADYLPSALTYNPNVPSPQRSPSPQNRPPLRHPPTADPRRPSATASTPDLLSTSSSPILPLPPHRPRSGPRRSALQGANRRRSRGCRRGYTRRSRRAMRTISRSRKTCGGWACTQSVKRRGVRTSTTAGGDRRSRRRRRQSC